MVCATLATLDLQRVEPATQFDTTRRIARTVRSLQLMLHAALDDRDDAQLEQMLGVFLHDEVLQGVRLSRAGTTPIVVGAWPNDVEEPQVWEYAERAVPSGTEVSFDQPTLVRAPFAHGKQMVLLELLVDGPEALQAARRDLARSLTTQCLVLTTVILLGLLLLRRWIAGPLEETVALVAANAGPEPFYDLSRRQFGEFSHLAHAIGGMLTRLDCTSQQLRQREAALRNLYQFAPAAMVTVDPRGLIVEANRRAAQLLGFGQESALIGKDILSFVHAHDRPALDQVVERLDVCGVARCELKLELSENRCIDALVECTGVCDDDGVLEAVRLSFQDVSAAKELQRKLADQTRLLDLVVNHMSDAILLVDANGVIAAHNRKVITLLQPRLLSLVGQKYDPAALCEQLCVEDQQKFIARLTQIAADQSRPAQERFKTRVGVLLFQGIPVHDASGASVGRLWVIQETSGLDQSQQLASQQKAQLQSLRKLGQRLGRTSSVDVLLDAVVEHVYEAMNVEALGVVLRRDELGSRGRQVLHRGSGLIRYESGRKLIEAVERHVMPLVLAQNEVMCWSDLPRTPWARDFELAGLTSLAAAPLHRGNDALGIVWIAQRGGERLEPSDVFMLEAVAPLVCSQLEVASLQERMNALDLTDPVTGLANQSHFRLMVQKLARRPGRAMAAITLNLDQFRKLNELLTHDRADLLLRTVAGGLKRSSRRSAFVCRLSGASFVMLCPDVNAEQALEIAQRLRDVLADVAQPVIDGQPWAMTVSVGVATCPQDAADVTTMIERALARLDAAKRSGGNRIVTTDEPAPQRRAG